jgi:hypothetical protein
MERVLQYLKNAKECRDIAKHAPSVEAKNHFARMADTWEALASERQVIIKKGTTPSDDGSSSV